MFSPVDEFENNRNAVGQNQDFINLNNKLIEVRDFLDEFGYLTFGRDISVFRRIGPVNGNGVLDSATRTLESIRWCCLNANFADAYSLLRKYRDDLFYYVYMLVVAEDSEFTQFVDVNQLNNDEKNIWDWVHNQQKDLHIGSVLKCIALHPSAGRAVKQFKLKDSFNNLAVKLNNYVHSNGVEFYNESYIRLVSQMKTKDFCDEFGEAVIFITVTFLFLATLVHPMLIMSIDYGNYLDVGDIPPEGSQYWVAPFISDFMKKYKFALDENFLNYLRENTEMKI